LAQAKATALKIKCVSNLKQIGVGIQMYLGDNEERLPGPLWTGQRFQYDITTTNILSYCLMDMLNTPKPAATLSLSPLFLCPSYEKAAPVAPAGAEQVAIIVNQDIDSGSASVRPFGYPVRGGNSMKSPLKATQLGRYGSLSDIYALTDADRKNSPPADNPWLAQLPAKAQHGNMRNELCFDWHVASKRIQ